MKQLDVDAVEVSLNDVVKCDEGDECGGTYVLDVDIEDESFAVNAQFGMTHNYKVSSKLSITNDSGGDMYDCGLAEHLTTTYGLSEGDAAWDALVKKIEEVANSFVTINTVSDLLSEKMGVTVCFEKGLAGANFADNCGLNKYATEDGQVVVAAEDASEPNPCNSLMKYRHFDDSKQYEQWFDEATEAHQGHWSGDFNLAIMLYEAL